jgi:hypothetical protein
MSLSEAIQRPTTIVAVSRKPYPPMTSAPVRPRWNPITTAVGAPVSARPASPVFPVDCSLGLQPPRVALHPLPDFSAPLALVGLLRVAHVHGLTRTTLWPGLQVGLGAAAR